MLEIVKKKVVDTCQILLNQFQLAYIWNMTGSVGEGETLFSSGMGCGRMSDEKGLEPMPYRALRACC